MYITCLTWEYLSFYYSLWSFQNILKELFLDFNLGEWSLGFFQSAVVLSVMTTVWALWPALGSLTYWPFRWRATYIGLCQVDLRKKTKNKTPNLFNWHFCKISSRKVRSQHPWKVFEGSSKLWDVALLQCWLYIK